MSTDISDMATSKAGDEEITKVPVSLEELRESNFSPGTLYWKRRSGSLLRLLGPGDVIDYEYLSKFDKTPPTLCLQSILNEEFVLEGQKYFQALSSAEDEKEKTKIRQEVIKWFGELFWKGDKKGSVLNLVIAMETVFYQFDDEITKAFKSTSVDNYKRSALIASMTSIFALILGYLDFDFLKDIYHLCYLFDYAFVEDQFSFNLIQAFELERLEGGKGPAYLHRGGSAGTESEVFDNHPKESYNKALQSLGQYFNNPGILKLILKHHERASGEGFPLGIHEGEMSDLENIITFVNNLVPYPDTLYQEEDGTALIKNLLNQVKNQQQPAKVLGVRLRNMLSNVFEGLENNENKMRSA